MGIISFAFNKISAEKTGVPKGSVKVNSNVKIASVEDAKLSFGSENENGVKINFEFKSEYDPKIGSISLDGTILYMQTDDKIAEIKKTFKEKKALPNDIMKIVLNNILSRANIESLLLSRELNLPPTMPMPRVNIKEEK